MKEMSVTRTQLQLISQQIYVLLSDPDLAKDIKMERAYQLLEPLEVARDSTAPYYFGYQGLDSQDPHHYIFIWIGTYCGYSLEIVFYCDHGIMRALKVNTPIRLPDQDEPTLACVSERFSWLKIDTDKDLGRDFRSQMKAVLPRLNDSGPGTRALFYLCLDVLDLLLQRPCSDMFMKLLTFVQKTDFHIEDIDACWKINRALIESKRIEFSLPFPPKMYTWRGLLCLAQAKIIAMDTILREKHSSKVSLFQTLLVKLHRAENQAKVTAKVAAICQEIVNSLPDTIPDTETLEGNWINGL